MATSKTPDPAADIETIELSQQPYEPEVDDDLLSVAPPPQYDLVIDNLTIGVPSALPIPIPIPKSLKRKFSKPSEHVKEPRSIVRDVSATCASGEMLAIIGASGSGKTTVLNAVVGRLSNLPIEHGSVYYSPVPLKENAQLSARKMKDKIGFVKQQDTFLENLTVRETLTFAAALRLPRAVSKESREMIVNHTIEELGLREAADTIIGGSLRKGISGGERRRLSIGCALVSLPSVLVADEPTTGLDAFTAYALLLTLSRLARRRQGALTVVCTLHQPRSATYPLFDRILLLSKGRVVYSGPRATCLPWFKSVDDSFVPHSGMNPMDWLIDISTVDLKFDNIEESRQRVTRLVTAWDERGKAYLESGAAPAGERPQEDKRSLVSEERPKESRRDVARPVHSEIANIVGPADGDRAKIGLASQTMILLRRAMINMRRNYGIMFVFVSQPIVLGIILGLTFYRLPETPGGIQSLKALTYQHLPFYTYLLVIYSVYRFCNTDLVIFDREREDHLYAAFPWLISEFLVNLPVAAISGVLFAVIMYFMTGMRQDDELGTALGVLIVEVVLQIEYSISSALLASSIFRLYPLASTLINATQIFVGASAGFFLIHVPPYILWIRWITPYFYGFRAVVISQFRNRTFACVGVTGTLAEQCEGNQVLRGLLIDPTSNPVIYLAALAGLTVVNYLGAGLLLAYYHPGGVKHARQLNPSTDENGPATDSGDVDIIRQRIDVEVRGLSLTWSRRRKTKSILHNVNAVFPSGEVTAILGPSGAGKSTLLQLIAGRHIDPGLLAGFDVAGQVLFNGQSVPPRNTRGLVSFVEQDDLHHLPALTVRETLRYAAILRLPKSMSRKRKLARADEVLQTLGLMDCADNMVGGELLKGISGGEKRRLSLAVEMINDPAVLIVDEPTSGLDAMTAHHVMLALKAIAASGRTVIASIHQPRSDIWHAGIDNVILLAKGGRVAFSGPKFDVGPLCASLGFPLPDMVNPADWILDLISVDARGDREKLTRQRVGAIVDHWATHETALSIEGHASDESKHVDHARSPLLDVDKQASVSVALPVVLERMMRNLWRQKPVYFIRLYQPPTLALIFLIIYKRLPYGPSGGQDRIGFVFQIVSPLAFVGVLNNVAVFPQDRDLYFHEARTSAAYSSATFLLAFTLVEVPLEIMGCLLSAIISNFGDGMQTSPRIFFQFVYVIWALLFAGESVGIMFSSFTKSMGFNISLVSTVISITVQACGIISVTMPKWISDLAWGTVTKYGARILMINECVGLRLYCTQDELASGQCLAQTGEELLAILGWKDLRINRFCGILLAVSIAYRLIAWFCLRAKVATL